MSERVRLTVDGAPRELEADPTMPLLYALRSELGVINPKFGCGLAQCGANAIFDATGLRMRRVPITPERMRAALARA